MTPTREQLLSIEWSIQDEDGGLWCPSCRSHESVGHRLDCWLAAALAPQEAAPCIGRAIDDAIAALRAPASVDKALAALNVLEGMARGFVRQNDGFDTTKKFADDVRAALAAPPAAGAIAAALATQEAAPMPPIEVRIAKLEDGTEEFDEVCAGACRNVHLEKMTDQMFALMIYTERETACFHIFTKNGRAHIDAREAWRETE